MKVKHIAITILFFIGMVTVQAQRGQRLDPKEQAKKSATTYQKEFGLSDEQKTKVYNFLLASSEKRTKKFQELRDNGGGREEMMEVFTKMQAETDKGLQKIFTKKQWPKYLKWKKENSRQRGRRRGGN